MTTIVIRQHILEAEQKGGTKKERRGASNIESSFFVNRSQAAKRQMPNGA